MSATAPNLVYSDEQLRRIRAAKHRFLDQGGGDVDRKVVGVRPEVLASWRRSALSGVDAAGSEVPREPVIEQPSPLVTAAAPITEQLEAELEGTRIWCFLLDRDCRLLAEPVGDRESVAIARDHGAVRGAVFEEPRMGTNGAGTALEQHAEFVVVGPEHFQDAAANLVTVGLPLRDPVTRRLLGLFGLNCRHEHGNELLLPYARRVMQAIRRQLRASRAAAEQALFDEFVRVQRRSRRPVAAYGGTLALLNDAARAALADADVDLVRHAALDAVRGGATRHVRLPVGADAWRDARCVPVDAGARSSPPGVVVELDPAFAPSPRSVAPSRSGGAPEDGADSARGGKGASPEGERSPPPGAGSSGADAIPRARGPRAQVVRADAAGHAVLVRGEAGVGKARLAAEGADDVEVVEVIDAADAARDPVAWAARFEAAAQRAGAVAVLTHVEEVPAQLAGEVGAMVAAARARVRATAGCGHVDEPRVRDLLARFPAVVDVAPLRERVDEIPGLVAAILAEGSPSSSRCAPDVMAALLASTWPGNVRQLRQVLVSAALRASGPVIEVDDLPEALVEADPRRHLSRMERLERDALVQALREVGDDKAAAADLLGISRATVYRRLKHFGIGPAATPIREPTRAE